MTDVQKLVNILDKADDKLLAQAFDIEKQLLKKIRKLLLDFSTKGRLDSNITSLQLLLQVDEALIDAVEKSKFSTFVNTYLANFETVTVLNGSIHKKLNDININRLDLNGTKRLFSGQVADGLLKKSNLKQGVTDKIKQELYLGIIANSRKSVIADTIERLVLGAEEGKGALCKHVRILTSDALPQYHGAIGDAVKKEFSLDGWRFLGSLIKTSRNTCNRWIREFSGRLPDEIIDEEIRLANIYNSALQGRLTRDNFGILRGGHRCRHGVIPTDFLEEEVENAIEIQKKIGSKWYS